VSDGVVPHSHPVREADPMLIGYARVSTDDQKLDVQRDALIMAGVDPERLYEDRLSSARADRPELAAALKAARGGDTLVIWRLDRLGRSLKELLALVDDLKQRGVQLRSLTDHIDTRTPGGELVFHVFDAIAQFERNLTRERVRAGLNAARSRGKLGGRPPVLKPKDLAAITALLKDGDLTIREVAERLGISVASLYRYVPGGKSAVQTD
jgi:DNA invertase Pin-like site-specific DNA recombinase